MSRTGVRRPSLDRLCLRIGQPVKLSAETLAAQLGCHAPGMLFFVCGHDSFPRSSAVRPGVLVQPVTQQEVTQKEDLFASEDVVRFGGSRGGRLEVRGGQAGGGSPIRPTNAYLLPKTSSVWAVLMVG